ncbi:ATP-binding protein [Lysobacter soli]|uniref:ATP-binding protein n=1 Tax=Lysobacter soli TaxID=453783 RepID=UPI0037C76B4B
MFKITARTVLELGAELISSDIIAFYELIKNAYDARSRTGADIHFNIVLRRNTYLRIRKNAELAKQQPRRAEALANLHQDLKRSLETSAGPERITRFMEAMDPATTLENFIKRLEDAYRTHNTIVVADTGTGMSVEELSTNYLTIGTPSRKKAVDKAIESKDEKPPFLGEKGIGRLSAMRLGEMLTVQTAREEDEWLNRLDVDWRDFNDIDAMIEDIDVEPYVSDVAKPTPDWSGTTLRIGDISEDWTEKRVQEMAEYDFARLTDPFQDPKSRPRIALHWNGARIGIPWMSKQLLDAAHASFRGEYLITENGPELVVHLEARNLGYPHCKPTRERAKRVYGKRSPIPNRLPGRSCCRHSWAYSAYSSAAPLMSGSNAAKWPRARRRIAPLRHSRLRQKLSTTAPGRRMSSTTRCC